MSRADNSFVTEIAELLTRHERTVIMLRYTEELSVEEIAQVLRLSATEVEETLKTVRKIIVDARTTLVV